MNIERELYSFVDWVVTLAHSNGCMHENVKETEEYSEYSTFTEVIFSETYRNISDMVSKELMRYPSNVIETVKKEVEEGTLTDSGKEIIKNILESYSEE